MEDSRVYVFFMIFWVVSITRVGVLRGGDLSICVLSICISVMRFSIWRLKGLMGFVCFFQRKFCVV